MTRLRYVLPIRDCTLNQWHIADRVKPNELVTLDDYMVDKGAIVSRPHVLKLDLSNPGRSVSGTSVQGLAYWRQGTNTNWLLMAVADGSTRRARMYAVLLDFTKTASADVVRRVIAQSASNALFGQHYAFLEYRGRVFASNGFETCVFDGAKWSNWNQNEKSPQGDWRRCGRQVAFNTATVFQDRPVLMGNKVYPEEIIYAKILEDWDEQTYRTGYQELGGFEGEIPITSLRAITFGGGAGYFGGEGGALYLSVNSGKTWTTIDAPETVNIVGLAASGSYAWLLAKTDDDLPVLYRGSNYGESWKLQSLPAYCPSGAGGVQFLSDEVGYVASVVPDAPGENWPSLMTTTNGTADPPTWSAESIAIPHEGYCTGISMINQSTGYVSAYVSTLAFGAVARKAMGVWSFQNLSTGKLNAISAADSLRAVVVGDVVDGAGFIKYTTDGTSWNPGVGLTAKNYYAVKFGSGRNVVAVGESGTILRSSNDGAGWGAASTNPATMDLRGLTYIDGKFFAVGDGGQIFTSIDEGVTWEAVESEKDKFTESLPLAEGEEIRAHLKAFGNLLVFTDHNIYALHEQFGQQIVCPGVEVLNDQCVKMWAGRVWFVGRYDGTPGVWAWDGNNPPALMSRNVQTTIDGLNFQPSPKNIVVKLDTQGEFTQPTSGVGLYYSTDVFRLKDGVLYCNRGQGGTIYSHADRDGLAENPETGKPYEDGYFFPDINNTSTSPRCGSFGTLAVELAMDETYVGTSYWYVYCKIEVRIAPTSSDTQNGYKPDSDKWTNWTHLVPAGLHPYGIPDSLPFGGQGAVFASYVMPIVHNAINPQGDPYFVNYSAANEPYQWIQFRITAANSPATNNKSNWRLNRICLMPQVNLNSNEDTASVVSPSLLVWNDKLWCHFGYTTIVYSNGGQTVSTTRFENANSSVVAGGRMVVGSKDGFGNPRVFYTQDNVEDVIEFQPLTPTLQTGRIDWSDVDPKFADIQKILRRITVKAKPTTKDTANVVVSWWADGNTSLSSSETLVFNDTHNPDKKGSPAPETATYQVRSIEVSSAPTNVNNYGTDFTVKIVGNSESVDILGITLECEIITDDIRESNFVET